MKMLLGGGRNRIGAAVALAAVLAMVLAAPAGAAGWGWGEEKNWSGGFFQHVLGWMGLAPGSGVNTKSDQGGSIDPNGIKLLTKHGLSIDPNGGSLTTDSTPIDARSSTDPNGRS
jgi:hypothetical protein